MTWKRVGREYHSEDGRFEIWQDAVKLNMRGEVANYQGAPHWNLTDNFYPRLRGATADGDETRKLRTSARTLGEAKVLAERIVSGDWRAV